MGEREVERHGKGEPGRDGREPDELAQEVPVDELRQPEAAEEEAAEHVQEGEAEGLRRAAEEAGLAAAGKEAAVHDGLEQEKHGKEPELQRLRTAARRARRPVQAVTSLEGALLGLMVAKRAAGREVRRVRWRLPPGIR